MTGRRTLVRLDQSSNLSFKIHTHPGSSRSECSGVRSATLLRLILPNVRSSPSPGVSLKVRAKLRDIAFVDGLHM